MGGKQQSSRRRDSGDKGKKQSEPQLPAAPSALLHCTAIISAEVKAQH